MNAYMCRYTHTYIYTSIQIHRCVHRGYIEDLAYYCYHITALLVRCMTDVDFLTGRDENVNTFLWRSFHAWRAAKGRAAE